MANLRVTQAGRQAAVQEASEARVTQAGRQVAIVDDATLRVTLMGRNMMSLELKPNTPLIEAPNADDVYTLQVLLQHGESTDPLGGSITYTARYSPAGMGTWTTIFSGRVGNDVYDWDISALTDGQYDLEVWASATGGTGKDSSTATVEFEVDNSSPSAPVITFPVEGQDLTQGTHRVTWLAATDPNSDPLTYKLDYRAVGGTGWTSIDTGVTDLFYDWDISLLAADDYEVRVIANDGTNDGPQDDVMFWVVTADQPVRPKIRVGGLSEGCVILEIEEYDHPTPRNWQSTTWEIIPWGGDFANPIVSYTTTDPDEQLRVEICDLPDGFEGQARAYFTDDASNDSFMSGTVEFTVPEFYRRFVQKWDSDAIWSSFGPGEMTMQNAQDGTAQEDSAVVLRDVEEMGSYYVTGEVMMQGWHYGISGRDTELRNLGVGVFEGYREDSSWIGVWAHIDGGTSQSLSKGIDVILTAALRIEVRWPDGGRSSTHVDIGCYLGRVISGWSIGNGAWLGGYFSDLNRDPWYRIELRVDRNVGASPTTRVRAKIHNAYGTGVTPSDSADFIGVPEDEWHIDITYNKLGPCGRPGYAGGQPGFGHGLQAQSFFRRLEFVALRDAGLPVPGNDVQPTFSGPVPPGECTPESEAALPTPIFFPIPPNGDVTEKVNFPTDVIGAWDDSEQRISLRERGKLTVGWKGTVLASQEATDFLAILFEEQPSRWIVPMWMDATPLLVTLASSSGSIPAASVDTTDRRFERMTHVVLYVDQFTYHESEAVLENDGSITLTTSTSQEFTGGTKGPTFVIPCRVGRMPQDLATRRPAPFVADMDFEFILEGVND